LSKGILSGIKSNPVRTKLVFLYAIYSHFIAVSVSNVNLKVMCNWLCKIKGHCGYGREFLQENACPFMFWDGSNLHRIYRLPENYNPIMQYASDFGSFSGLMVRKVDQETYQEVKDNRTKLWDYSIVPEQHEEVILNKAKRLVLLHSFYKVKIVQKGI
jgi:hypothetical protein